MSTDALLVVDVQNDFLPGGSLGVPAGRHIIDTMNEYLHRFERMGALLVASRDWHPPVTRHFKDHGGIWPVHCVMGTPGAEFHPDLVFPESLLLASKGMEPDEDSYSAFQARLPDGRLLGAIREAERIRRIYIGGLATDYCVRASVLDALANGLEAVILLDASRGVDVNPGDSEKSIAEMVSAGASVTTLNRL